MEHTHPSTEQLSFYMESPEAAEHKDIRHHLMGCGSCRTRVDNLTRLELDIKHYAPRFSPQPEIYQDHELQVERYIDRQLDELQRTQTRDKIHTDPQSLKAALHYAVHSATMSKNMDSLPASAGTTSVVTANAPSASYTVRPGFMQRVWQILDWRTPAWTVAPVALALAAVISYSLLSTGNYTRNNPVQVVAFQDNAVVNYQLGGMPKGSIGFFHDAQSRTEPFAGMRIRNMQNKMLRFDWPAVTHADSYTLEIFSYQQGNKVSIKRLSSNQPGISVPDIALADHQHYAWTLSGRTSQGQQFSTEGEFIYLKHVN